MFLNSKCEKCLEGKYLQRMKPSLYILPSFPRNHLLILFEFMSYLYIQGFSLKQTKTQQRYGHHTYTHTKYTKHYILLTLYIQP